MFKTVKNECAKMLKSVKKIRAPNRMPDEHRK